MILDIYTGEAAQTSLRVLSKPEYSPDKELFLSPQLISPESVLHSLRQFLAQSLREGGGEDARGGGHDPHDEDGGGQPVDLQEVQQEAGDAAYPGHQGAEANCLQSERESQDKLHGKWKCIHIPPLPLLVNEMGQLCDLSNKGTYYNTTKVVQDTSTTERST